MTSLAARVARWLERGSPVQLAAPASGGPANPGVPILVRSVPIGSLTMTVEFAWGAMANTPSSSWQWVDVSADVQYSSGLGWSLGRQDQASAPQPAQANFVLDNRSGAYSKDPSSSNYPNVNQGTPVQISYWYLGVRYVQFFGYVSDFTPAWDTTGNYAITQVTAAGSKQRLQRSSTPLLSAMTRSIPTLTDLVAYWPCEDASGTTVLASGIPGDSGMSIAGVPDLAGNGAILSSGAIPVMGTGTFYGGANGPNTGAAQARCLVVFPIAADASPDKSVIFRMYVYGGTIAFWNVLYGVGGGLELQAYDQLNNLIYDSGAQAYGIDGQMGRLSISVTQSGGNLAVQLSWYEVDSAQASYSNFTVTGQTIGGVAGISIAPFADQTNVAIGQVYLESTVTDVFALSRQVNGFVNEFVGTRMPRLASEQGEYLEVIGPTTQEMGVQTPDTYYNLMQDSADVDLGFLYDGHSQGMTFITKDDTTSQPVNMTLDASLGQVAPDLQPIDDDYLNINKYTATRINGSSSTFQDMTSTKGINRVGEYAQSTSLDFLDDGEQLYDYAAWLVHVGTRNDYRWSPLNIWLERNPELLVQWLNFLPTDRIDLINLDKVRSQFSHIPISCLAQGWQVQMDQFLIRIAINTTPYEPYRVGILAATTGDTGEFLVRLDTDGAYVTTAISAGATSLSITTPSGPLWTTAADDVPLQVDIAGRPITVTAITGTTSPQTFTVDPTTVLAPIAANTAVNVWQEAVLDTISYIAGQ